MSELANESVHLVVTSPPYFNAPFDYPDLFKDYDEYLEMLKAVMKEIYRVLAPGRIACFVTQDVRIDGKLYPIVSDLIKIGLESGFTYRDRIIWKKPEGYIRISRRSGVLIQHPYPMYYYPDNIFEDIVIFQKGEYKYPSENEPKVQNSKININEFQSQKWYLSVWEITNVLPIKGRVDEGVAAFPEEIPYRLIKLFSYVGETVLDPFAGSGTTLKVAYELGRKAVGYEIDVELLDIIKKKLSLGQAKLYGEPPSVDIKIREDAKHLRSKLLENVKAKSKSKTKVRGLK